MFNNKIVAGIVLVILLLVGLFLLFITLKIMIDTEKARVFKIIEGLEQEVIRLETQQAKNKEKDLIEIERQFQAEKKYYETMMNSLHAIKNQQLKLIPKLEAYKKQLEEKIENYEV